MPSAPLTPEQRRLRGQFAAHARWSKQDPKEGTAAARKTFLDRFEREVDPGGTLPPEERARRAASAKSAYFKNLAYQSSRARQARAGAK